MRRPLANRTGGRPAPNACAHLALDKWQGNKGRTVGAVAVGGVGGLSLHLLGLERANELGGQEEAAGLVDGDGLAAAAGWEEGLVGQGAREELHEAVAAVVVRARGAEDVVEGDVFVEADDALSLVGAAKAAAAAAAAGGSRGRRASSGPGRGLGLGARIMAVIIMSLIILAY